MSVRELVLGAACGGCNAVWGLSEQSPHAVDAVVATCAAHLPQDDFTAAPICGGVGVPISGSAESLVAGDLVITLVAGETTYAGCLGQTLPAFTGTGLFVDVPLIATGPDEYNALRAHWDDAVNVSEIDASPVGLTFSHGLEGGDSTPLAGPVPLVPWWRIRPSADGTSIVGEASADGVAWTLIGTDPVAPPARIRLELSIGAFRADTRPSAARVASIDVCP